MDFLKTNQVDAVIMCAIENDWDLIKQYRQYGLIAVCNEYVADSDTLMVRADQESGMYAGAKYLLNRGYRKLAFVRTESHSLQFGSGGSQQRSVSRLSASFTGI